MRDSNDLAMWVEWSGKVDQMVSSNKSTKFKVQSLDESECQAQHNSSYAVGYNGYIQTDLAQSNNVYLFYVLTIAPLFSLVVAAEPDILTYLSFELCILVAPKPFNLCCQTIRFTLQNYSNRAAKPFKSCIGKPFESCIAKPFELNRVAKPFDA